MSRRLCAVVLAVCHVLGAVSFGAAAEAQVPTLVIGIPTDPMVENYETNYMTLRLEQMNQVNLEFFQFPSDAEGAKSKLALMVSSNSKLPDVLCFENLDDATVLEYGSKGVFVPIESYLYDAAAMPFFGRIDSEMRDYLLSNTKSPDGHIYSLSKYGPWAWNTGAFRMWVNDNWLETLGLSMPETIDDFYDVLTHFVNDDPNGNGIKDEIGLVGAKDGWALNVIPFVMNAFVYTNQYKSYLMVEDGQVKPSYTQDGWREGLEFLHKLVEEGLLSSLSFTQDQSQLKALIQKEGGVAGFVPAGSYSTFAAGTALEFDEMDLVPPLTGPEGQCNTSYNPDLPVKVWFVTKDCEDVALAVRVGDSFYDKEMSRISRFGEKGVEWDDDPEICKLWWNPFEDIGVATSFYTLDSSFWGNMQNKCWYDRNPKYAEERDEQGEGVTLYSEIPAEGEALTKTKDYNAAFFNTYAQHFPKEYIANLVYTQEETEEIAVISADILNYVNTMSVAFIIGNRSLDEWDAYLEELDKMGLDTYLEATQNAYERSR